MYQDFIQFVYFLYQYRNEEYETLKEVLEEIDKTQNLLYHDSNDKAKLDTILGLIEVTQLLDSRVQELFEDGYHCPQEVDFIKSVLM